MNLEVGSVTFAGVDSGTYNFTETFTSAPSITAISVDTTVAGDANVNVYVSSISTTQVIFKTSAPFTGKVSFQAIETL